MVLAAARLASSCCRYRRECFSGHRDRYAEYPRRRQACACCELLFVDGLVRWALRASAPRDRRPVTVGPRTRARGVSVASAIPILRTCRSSRERDRRHDRTRVVDLFACRLVSANGESIGVP